MDKLFWLIPGKLAGRAGPVVEPWDLAAMRDAGVTAIVSTDEDCHGESIKAEGIKHIQKFMPTAYPTNQALVEHFTDLVHDAAQEVIRELKEGGCVVVHCYAGRDRTGLVLSAVLMQLEGLSAKESFKRVRAIRPTAMTGPGVTDVLEEYSLRLQSCSFEDGNR